jgi:hypothetical protein
MNQENDEKDMRPEYDIRGGVRGKYLERYRATTIAFADSPFIAGNTSRAIEVGAVTRPTSYPPFTVKIQIGARLVPADAG